MILPLVLLVVALCAALAGWAGWFVARDRAVILSSCGAVPSSRACSSSRMIVAGVLAATGRPASDPRAALGLPAHRPVDPACRRGVGVRRAHPLELGGAARSRRSPSLSSSGACGRSGGSMMADRPSTPRPARPGSGSGRRPGGRVRDLRARRDGPRLDPAPARLARGARRVRPVGARRRRVRRRDRRARARITHRRGPSRGPRWASSSSGCSVVGLLSAGSTRPPSPRRRCGPAFGQGYGLRAPGPAVRWGSSWLWRTARGGRPTCRQRSDGPGMSRPCTRLLFNLVFRRMDPETRARGRVPG